MASKNPKVNKKARALALDSIKSLIEGLHLRVDTTITFESEHHGILSHPPHILHLEKNLVEISTFIFHRERYKTKSSIQKKEKRFWKKDARNTPRQIYISKLSTQQAKQTQDFCRVKVAGFFHGIVGE